MVINTTTNSTEAVEWVVDATVETTIDTDWIMEAVDGPRVKIISAVWIAQDISTCDSTYQWQTIGGIESPSSSVSSS